LLGPRDITPPVVNDIEVDSIRCCKNATLTAVVEDQCSSVAEAEYFLLNEGGCGDPGTGTPMNAADGSFDSTVEGVDAVIDVPCPDGTYNLWVRGRDAAGNWGECKFYLLVVQNGAPTTYNVTVEDMTVKATIEGLSVLGAEYFIDQKGPVGFGTPMNAADGAFGDNKEDVVAEITENLSIGSHTIYVHGKDSEGYWGNFGKADFTVYVSTNVNITYPTEGWYKDTVTVSYTTDGTECSYRYINNGTESQWSSVTCNNDFVFDTNSCLDGSDTCTIEVRAKDGLYYGYDSATFSVDNSAPIITYVSLSSDHVEQNSLLNITSDGHDPQGLKSCYAFLMSGDNVLESFNLGSDCSDTELIPSDVPDGDYIIKVRARNRVDTDSFAETALKVGKAPGNGVTSITGGSSGSSSGSYYGNYYAFSNERTCVEKWICTSWSKCVDGNRTRTCIDENRCNTTAIKPNEKIDCKVNIPEEEGGVEGNVTETTQEIKYPAVGITGLFLSAISDPLTALIIIIGIIILVYLINRILRKRSKKNGKGKKGTVGIKRRRK
jgi:hypothetical protein